MSFTLDPDVQDLARDVVASVAPAELPIFNTVIREYAKDPNRALRAASGKDEVLGFGLEAGLLLSPPVIAVAQTVITFIGVELLKLGQQAASSATDAAVHGVLARVAASRAGSAAPNSIPLTAAQLAEVHRVALARAKALGVPADQADRLADAMVSRLAVSRA